MRVIECCGTQLAFSQHPLLLCNGGSYNSIPPVEGAMKMLLLGALWNWLRLVNYDMWET